MPMLFWLPMIVMSAMLELSTPATIRTEIRRRRRRTQTNPARVTQEIAESRHD
jgi:hypothetical protein